MKKLVFLFAIVLFTVVNVQAQKKEKKAVKVIYFDQNTSTLKFSFRNFWKVKTTTSSDDGTFVKFFLNGSKDTVRVENWKKYDDGGDIIIKIKDSFQEIETTLVWKYEGENFNDLMLKILSYTWVGGDKKSFKSEWKLPLYADPTGPFEIVEARDLNAGFIPVFHKHSHLLVFCEKEKIRINPIPEEIKRLTSLKNEETMKIGIVNQVVTKKVTPDSTVYTSVETGVYEILVPHQTGSSRNQQGLVGKRYISTKKVDRRINYTVRLKWTGEGDKSVATGTISIGEMEFPVKCSRDGRKFTQKIKVGEKGYNWMRK